MQKIELKPQPAHGRVLEAAIEREIIYIFILSVPFGLFF
jgi:hypothetical protein